MLEIIAALSIGLMWALGTRNRRSYLAGLKHGIRLVEDVRNGSVKIDSHTPEWNKALIREAERVAKAEPK